MWTSVLIFFTATELWAALPPANYNPYSGTEAKVQLHIYLDKLETELNKAKTPKEKYKALNNTLTQISALRDHSLPSADDETYIELLVTGLESLPKEMNFKKESCQRYRAEYLNQFEPLADEAPEEPAVQPGWNVLQSICR